MIAGVTFASCYVYSPTGADLSSARSRLMRALLKDGDAYFMDKYADRVRRQVAEGPSLVGFFRDGSVLVPVPGCAPCALGSSSPARGLACALLAGGLGQCLWTGLRRVHAVPKSATAMPGSRPTVGTHYHSFAVQPAAMEPQYIVLVDDVVTKGRTLLAAAARMQEAYPSAEIRAFALVRTMGRIQGVAHLIDPCIGRIRWRHGDAWRSP